jgi:hypothetical protein
MVPDDTDQSLGLGGLSSSPCLLAVVLLTRCVSISGEVIMRQPMLKFLPFATLLATTACAFGQVYTDGNLTVDWTHNASAYIGKLTLGAQQFPATAHDSGDEIDGSFQAGGSSFPFTAKLQADVLTLTTGAKTYTLKSKSAAPVNPLGSAAAAASPAGAPVGYTVINHTDAGQAFSTTKAGAKSVREALRDALADLGDYFDAKPSVGGAYEDNQTHKAGGATFTATLKNQPVHGILSTKLDDNGASIAVVYCRTDASADDWKKLNAPPPSPQDAVPAAVKLKTYEFPDGTGSIGLADGWTTQAQSDLDTIFIQGSGNRHVAIGATWSIVKPDSPMVQMQMQNAARARQMGMQPSAPPPMLIAPFSGPGDALTTLVPQLSEIYQHNGGPAIRLDKIISEQSIQASQPNGKASVLAYLITVTRDGKSEQVRNIARMECDDGGQGFWSTYMIELTAPADTFNHDQPTMLAMLHSQKENADVCQRIIAQRQQANAQNIAQQQQQLQTNGQNLMKQQQDRFEAGQEAHRQQMAGYDAHNQQWARDENAKSRSNDNYVEMLRGYRTVINTQTGEKTSVDYYNVGGIVNGLNTAANDPNRYVQIPLRDEKDPVVGR